MLLGRSVLRACVRSRPALSARWFSMGQTASADGEVPDSFYSISDTLSNGTEVQMEQYRGKVLYITNVASK